MASRIFDFLDRCFSPASACSYSYSLSNASSLSVVSAVVDSSKSSGALNLVTFCVEEDFEFLLFAVVDDFDALSFLHGL